MATNIKHAIFIIIGIVALFTTWPFAFDWMRNGGNILDPIAFFGDAIKAGGTASFLAVDMTFAWITYMIWVVYDAKRIGAGYKWGWIWLAISYIGVSMAFPFYLVFRERFLDKQAKAG